MENSYTFQVFGRLLPLTVVLIHAFQSISIFHKGFPCEICFFFPLKSFKILIGFSVPCIFNFSIFRQFRTYCPNKSQLFISPMCAVSYSIEQDIWLYGTIQPPLCAFIFPNLMVLKIFIPSFTILAFKTRRRRRRRKRATRWRTLQQSEVVLNSSEALLNS